MAEPRQLGSYTVVDVIGRGGMGVVYEAMGPAGTPSAIKTVRAATESSLESIRREVLMLRALRHPGVVTIRDDGVAADGTPWYAMELLQGRTLRDDLRVWFPAAPEDDGGTRDLKAPRKVPAARRPVTGGAGSTPPYSLAHVAELFRRICEPLAYVHGQGVIHRDLSPGNIFLAGDHPVLFDFGLAAQVAAEGAREVLEVGGYVRGTAHYMAPEQARGEVVDARADIYALGCILYEALTGRPPFLAGDDGVLAQHLGTEPAPPSAFAPAAHGFDALVMRMLAKRPRDRVGYVGDVAAALERLGASRVAASAPAPPRAYTYRAGLAGRRDSLVAFEQRIERLGDGLGGCTALIGESGAGKTRLAAELATIATAHDARVITGECQPLAVGEPAIRGTPLHPLRPLLRTIADLCREHGPVTTERLLGADGGLLAAFEPALHGLTPAVARVGPSALRSPALRFRLLSVLRDVLEALARVSPVVLVIDDLQWADELTLAFLGSLTPDWLRRTPVHLLLTARAEELSPDVAAVLAHLGAETLQVARLDRAAVGAMVHDMLALETDAPTLTEFVAARSEGNPLFVAEYLRLAVDEGVVVRDADGRWRLTDRAKDAYHELPTPGSVREIARRQVAQLGPVARELVGAAAILGRTCDPDVLAATSELDDDTTRNGVAELIRRHVLEEHDGGLRFVHDSMREFAHAALPAPARDELHRRAARAVEHRYATSPDFPLRYAELAHHWEHAGDRVRAVDYLERAAEHAFDTSGHGEARRMLTRLLELGAEAEPARRARWLRRLGEASYALGDVEGLARHSERALAELGRTLPRSRWRLAGRVAIGILDQLWARAVPRETPREIDRVAVEAALASAQMTTHYFFNEDSLGLVGAALAAANLAERGGHGLAIAEIYAQLGYVAGVSRLSGVARTYFAQARRTATSTNDTIGMIKTLNAEAALAIGVGAWDDVRARAGEALALARSIRDPQDAEDALTILGHAEFASGAYARSCELARALRTSARDRANLQHEAWGIYTEGRAALYLGELDAALACFEQAMGMLAGLRDRASLILCGGMQASALVRRGDVERARAVAAETSARIGTRIPAVFSITEGLVGLADAYLLLWARTGDAALAEAARGAVGDLAKLSRLLPIAGPPATIRAGVIHARSGEHRQALKALRRGLAGAERLDLLHDQAVAHVALAAVAPPDAGHADTAAVLAARLGLAPRNLAFT